MVRDEVLEHLNGRHPALQLVLNLRLATRAHNPMVVQHGVRKISQAWWVHFCICINHEHKFEKVRRHSHERMHFAEQIIVQGRHRVIVRDVLEEVHQHHLRITFASVAGLFRMDFVRHTTLDHNDHRHRLAP